jgi:hypothetical protein
MIPELLLALYCGLPKKQQWVGELGKFGFEGENLFTINNGIKIISHLLGCPRMRLKKFRAELINPTLLL